MLFPSRNPFGINSLHRRRLLGLLGIFPWAIVACGRSSEVEQKGLGPGRHLPVLTLPGLNGDSLRLGEGGAVMLLNFWATWCPPCRAEMAALERLHLGFSGRGLQVVGISVDEDVFLVREYVFQEKLTFPIFLDPRAEVSGEVLGINAYPTSYLVDRSGRVAKVWVGAADWGGAEVQAEIVRSLGG